MNRGMSLTAQIRENTCSPPCTAWRRTNMSWFLWDPQELDSKLAHLDLLCLDILICHAWTFWLVMPELSNNWTVRVTGRRFLWTRLCSFLSPLHDVLHEGYTASENNWWEGKEFWKTSRNTQVGNRGFTVWKLHEPCPLRAYNTVTVNSHRLLGWICIYHGNPLWNVYEGISRKV